MLVFVLQLSVSSEPAPQPPLSLNVCDDLSNDSPLVVDDARSTTPIPGEALNNSYLKTFSAGVDFIRQNLTSVDVRF